MTDLDDTNLDDPGPGDPGPDRRSTWWRSARVRDRHVGAVAAQDECWTAPPCPHCAAGRPAAPIEVGDPRELSAAVRFVTRSLRVALPPAFHRPEFHPPAFAAAGRWRCACCWDRPWPCPVVIAHGGYLTRSMVFELHVADRHNLLKRAEDPPHPA